MRARTTLVAIVMVVACGKKSASTVIADGSAPKPIQCWRRSGIRPPGTRPAIANVLLAKGAMRVYLDPKHPGVVVPDRLRHDIRTVLVFGRAPPVPVPDLVVDDEAISGTLSFDHAPFPCRVPWSAVYALTTNEDDAAGGGVWEDSVPGALFCKD